MVPIAPVYPALTKPCHIFHQTGVAVFRFPSRDGLGNQTDGEQGLRDQPRTELDLTRSLGLVVVVVVVVVVVGA
jgi:hypothetical protein